MLYPVYVHMGDAKHAHGVTFPDFPGCFSAADEWSVRPAGMAPTNQNPPTAGAIGGFRSETWRGRL